METKIAIFKGQKIRKTIHKNEWWLVVNDVVVVLTDTPNVQDYIKKMRKRDEELGKGWGQFVTPLAIQTAGGFQRLNCANTEGIFRIIQSIPSPKAEPFKLWLARGFVENKQAAYEGGAVAGNARKELERKSGKRVSTRENYLKEPQNKKLLK